MTTTLDAGVGSGLRTLRPFGRHGWSAWTVGMLRSAGFSADGLDLLSVPALGPAADAALDGTLPFDTFVAQFEAAASATSRHLNDVANDPHFGCAIAWQNTPMLRNVERLRTSDASPNSRRRAAERSLWMYWQRYCGKADTIGSFGPFAWFGVGDRDEVIAFEHGDTLIERVHHSFEAWMVVELGAWLASRPELRWWLPPVLNPAVELDEPHARLLIPGQPPLRLRATEAAVLRLIDGIRSARIIAGLLAAPETDMTDDHVRRILESFARRRLLDWDANIPISVNAWSIFRQRVAAVEDATLRAELDDIVARFEDALAAVGEATDAMHLEAALGALNEEFTRTTGREAHRNAGSMYAARTLCYFDAHRAVRGGIGTAFLERIDDALDLLLRSADWYAVRLTDAYTEALSDLVRRHREAHPGRPVHLSDVWNSSMALFWGDAPTPLNEISSELSTRWTSILGRFADHLDRVHLTADELADAVYATFGEASPLPELSVHSPDVQIVASNPGALAAGDFTVVLGELHACFASLDVPAVEWSLPDGTVREAINETLGLARLVPLLPESWRRNTGRVAPATAGPSDRWLGFTRAAAPDRTRVWAMASVEIVAGPDGDELLCPDGRRLPLVSAWLVPIGMVAADGFKVGLGGGHTPRLTIDRVVLFRETWRLPTDDIELPSKPNRHADFLAVRAWQRRHGLPDEVFVKFAAEVKPTYLSFCSIPLVANFVASVRAQRKRREAGRVTVSECLPRPQDSWLTDATGRRYVSEIRLQVTRLPETGSRP